MAWRQAPKTETSGVAKVRARKLRRTLTDAEKALWVYFRGDFAGPGTHFRRQVPIGPYVVDFCCIGHRLIIELDGPIHDSPEAVARDRARETYLTGQRFRVLRFRNEEVRLKRDDVLNFVKAALAATTPTPNPSPQGGGEHPWARA